MKLRYERAVAAYRVVACAIRHGFLKPAREHRCVDCGGCATVYDHRDYEKPLDVQPVCSGCNVRRGGAVGHDAPPVGRPKGRYVHQKPAAPRTEKAGAQ